MDRRVLGSGMLVCSAMVVWAQPATPRASVENCEKDSPTPACATTNRVQAVQTPTLASIIRHAPALLPFRTQWSGMQSDRLPENMETMYGNLLKQAQAAVQDDRGVVAQDHLISAVAAIAGIPKNSRHYELAQKLQEDWSQELLQRATNRCQQGDVSAALSIVNAIAPTSPQHARAVELRAVWIGQAKVLEQAKLAQSRGDWQGVIEAIESLQGMPLYNSSPVQALLQQSISNQFQPDAALMHLASANLLPPISPGVRSGVATSRAAMRPEPSKTAISASPPSNETKFYAADPAVPVDSLPDAPRLEIGLAQAMEWAQPLPPAVASAPRAAHRQLAVVSRSTSLPPGQTPIVLPQPVAALPSVRKAVQPSELASPRSNNLVTTQPTVMPAIE